MKIVCGERIDENRSKEWKAALHRSINANTVVVQKLYLLSSSVRTFLQIVVQVVSEIEN